MSHIADGSVMDFHRFADIFPLLAGPEYDELVSDIRVSGLIEPIVTYEDKILDGRNRYRACRDACVEPRFISFDGDDALAFVISLNLRRRHLNESQRDAARGVEHRSLDALRPFIQQRAFNGQFVVTNKGPLALELQKSAGDILYNTNADTVYSAEIKAEERNTHGNFFLEVWSNRARFTPGWMFTLKTDLLLYHFVEDDELYAIPFERLRKWAFHDLRIWSFPERKQAKYDQINDTWGRCVQIEVLAKELKLSAPFRPRQSTSQTLEAGLL